MAMIFTPKIQKAIQFAITAHARQTRKGKDIPYITHPLSVALILARAGADEDVVIAGILHDTVEDSDGKITFDDVEREFGETVAMLVRHVTEEDKSLSWEERKQQALTHIYEMPYGALLLKSADVLHNLSELVADIKEQGDVVWDRFNAPKDRQIVHYQNLIENLEIIWKENLLLPEIKAGVGQLLTKKKLDFDQDSDGITLPTLRNNKIVHDLYQEHKSVEKLEEILGEDYTKLAMRSLFDPRKENVFFDTPELALEAKERADLINRLDEEWLSKRK